MAHGTALLLNNEISSVVTAMRNNSKWALVPNRYGQRVHRMWMLLLAISCSLPHSNDHCSAGR